MTLSSIATWPKFKGKARLVRLCMSFSSRMQSAYGPALTTRRRDQTLLFALNGSYGHELADLINEVPRDSIFFDIGANIGLYSLLASKHLRKGQVFSFEPNALVYRDLLSNIELNGCKNVIPFNMGLGSSTQIATLKFNPKHSGKASFLENAHNDVSINALVIDGASFPFEDIVPADSPIYIKIDVEGFENSVLEGLFKSKISNRIAWIFIEISEKNDVGNWSDVEKIYTLMTGAGFVAQKGLGYSDHYDELFVRPN